MFSNLILDLNIDSFDKVISIKNKIIIIDFWSEWCSPCKMLIPILNELADEMKDVIQIFKVNVNNSLELAKKFNVHGIPTLIFLKNGKKIDESLGFISKEELKRRILSF